MFNQYGTQFTSPYQGLPTLPTMPAYQPQTSYQSRGISGRTVSSLAEVTPSEVAMDGTVSWFPAADGSMVWAKAWAPDGTIRTTAYAPVPAEPAPVEGQGQNGTLEAILERLDGIEAALKAKKKGGGE